MIARRRLLVVALGERRSRGELLGDLARDHTIVSYDARGSGEVDPERTVRRPRRTLADYGALVDEVAPVAVVLAFGDGSFRAVRAAAEPGSTRRRSSRLGQPARTGGDERNRLDRRLGSCDRGLRGHDAHEFPIGDEPDADRA